MVVCNFLSVMACADSVFTQNWLLVNISLVNWFAGILGASIPVTLESKGAQAAGMTEVWALSLVVGGMKFMASQSCAYNDELNGVVTQVLSLVPLSHPSCHH